MVCSHIILIERKNIMDYLALRIPVDTSKPITAHTVTDQPSPEEGGGFPFKGENGAYALTESRMLEIVPAAYSDALRKQYLEGDLYVDEEGLLKGRVRNWRASQMRYWWMKQREKDLVPNWREYAHIVGTACFVVPATKENLAMMEDILDS